ncbi:hypothetical protein EIP86_008132 [Pleurotus ostreatoroseus]|nr:hypothetical protein EIP86_008132 [Pleurotus ostreatoroseus]
MAQQPQKGTSRNKRPAAENALMNRILLGRTPAFQPSQAAWKRTQTSRGPNPVIHPALQAAATVVGSSSAADIAKTVTAEPLSKAADRLAQGDSEGGEQKTKEDDMGMGPNEQVCNLQRTGLKGAERVQQSAPDPGDAAKKGTGRLHKDRPSVKMKMFLTTWAIPAWKQMFAREGGPKAQEGGVKCRNCKKCPEGEVVYRCKHCFHGVHLCKTCCVRAHEMNPLHFVEEWDPRRGFWLKTTLGQLGLIINLGHGGDECEVTTDGWRRMTVISEHGIQEAKMRFCRHGRKEECLQLIEAGLWPGSWLQPRTAMTLECMHEYQMLSGQAQVSAMDYFTYLRRLTDNVCPQDVADRYKDFLTASREYCYIKLCKYFGVEPSENMKPASLAVRCPACPQPDINMHPDWKNRPPHLKFLDALFHAVDGNFSQNMKNKKSDPNDVPLTSGGSAYFAYEKDVATYLRHAPKGPPEASTCHKFGVLGYFGHWGSVSGTIGLGCARHMFALPSGAVDLQKGERYANVDIAMLCGLQLWMELPMFVSAYDINCQFQINFGARMEAFRKMTAEFSTAKKFLDVHKILAGVGKFHLPAHCPACRFKWSFNYLPGVGMTDGEEMSAGFRHDVLNVYFSDLNTQRMHGLARSLSNKYRRAVFHEQTTREYMEQLEEEVKDDPVLGVAALDRWKEEEKEWLEKVVKLEEHKDLENIYELKEKNRLSQEEMLKTLTEKAGEGVHSEGLIGVILEGIELQEMKAMLLQELASEDTPEVLPAAIQEEYDTFGPRVDSWRERAVVYLSPLVDQAAETLSEAERSAAAAELADWGVSGQVDEEVSVWLPDGEEYDTRALKRRRVTPESEDEAKGTNTKRRRKAKVTTSIGTKFTMTMLSSYSKTAGGSGAKRKRSGDSGKVRHNKAWKDVNSVQIELPSSHHALVREHEALKGAIEVEKQLRKLQAQDALDDLRTLLITSYGLNADRKRLTGQKMTTRATHALKRKWMQIRVAAGKYRRVRIILVKLGMPEDDKEFLPLRREDVKAYIVLAGGEQLGDSTKLPSWIWEKLSYLRKQGNGKIQDYCVEATRVLWFRQNALATRWREEALLLPTEMWRTVAFFRFWEDWWEAQAKKWDEEAVEEGRQKDVELDPKERAAKARNEEAKIGEAAYARRQAHRYNRLLHGCELEFKDAPEMVTEAIEKWAKEKGWRTWGTDVVGTAKATGNTQIVEEGEEILPPEEVSEEEEGEGSDSDSEAEEGEEGEREKDTERMEAAREGVSADEDARRRDRIVNMTGTYVPNERKRRAAARRHPDRPRVSNEVAESVALLLRVAGIDATKKAYFGKTKRHGEREVEGREIPEDVESYACARGERWVWEAAFNERDGGEALKLAGDVGGTWAAAGVDGEYEEGYERKCRLLDGMLSVARDKVEGTACRGEIHVACGKGALSQGSRRYRAWDMRAGEARYE